MESCPIGTGRLKTLALKRGVAQIRPAARWLNLTLGFTSKREARDRRGSRTNIKREEKNHCCFKTGLCLVQGQIHGWGGLPDLCEAGGLAWQHCY